VLKKTKYYLKENSWLARIAAWKLKVPSVAIVMGHTIHLHHVKKEAFLQNPQWLRHELCHVKQFEQHGFFPFLIKYFWESLKLGYYNNKYEVEARQAENEC
jgi:hypothetical protein